MNLLKSWNMLSWYKARTNVFRFQKRIFKAVLVGDVHVCLLLQKLLITSNSSRLLAIRFSCLFSVQIHYSNNVSLSFVERYNLNRFLLLSSFNWNPTPPKKVFFSDKYGFSSKKNILSLADSSWQILISFALEAAHEAVFSPRNFGFRSNYSIFEAQKIIFLNLNKVSFGYQKRILLVNLVDSFEGFNLNYLLKRLILPRTIKLGVFRFLKLGFLPNFPEIVNILNVSILDTFSVLLANILLNEIDKLFNSVRVGSKFLIMLNPFDNENYFLELIESFLKSIGLRTVKNSISVFCALEGFDFLGWNFRVYNDLNIYCCPSVHNYKFFLRRVKNIVNNSNYGAVRFIRLGFLLFKISGNCINFSY